MRLADLLAAVPHRWVRGAERGGEIDVVQVTHDSRKAVPGSVFVARPGLKDDGLRHAADALSRGSAALVLGPGRGARPEAAGWERVVEVDDERVALAMLARRLHGEPDTVLTMVGVTGTKGKTTTCRLIQSVLEASGVRAGLLGTVGYATGDGAVVAADRTTPEAPELHALLARMRDAGCRGCVMEVSSQGLDLGRVHGIGFSVAVFTNLTRDHLDYHKDMESYFAVKRRLFEELPASSTAVIHADDPYGARLLEAMRTRSRAPRLIPFGSGPGAAVRLVSTALDARESRLEIEEGAERRALRTPLIGRHNAANVVAAAAAGRALGAGWDAIVRGIEAVAGVDGRMERVLAGDPAHGEPDFEVVVDYAHTDDALRLLLETVRPLARGRVILVFGCGGDRDRGKRPLMGAHAARLADVVHVTSDNPRTEDPESIVNEILAGIAAVPSSEQRRGLRVHADVDRTHSIEAAIAGAGGGDVVEIAGQGHATYQILGERVIHCVDREVAREALRRRIGRPS